ncbi:DUF2306 domain-containing protein [Cellulomonas sp. URHD0024]|uniref:DUF2306 domain-containing protein n=1 Tax=Cellulomonas sp. URHD0024 TaxID=1302620 RepID=UPI0004069D0E|nr:DUF2306 domain-containing protein [Cellulomonas sp. URHD0024]
MTTTAAPPAPQITTVRRNRVGWTAVLLASVGVVAFSAVPYFTASLSTLADQDSGLAKGYAGQPAFVQAALYVHITFATLALLLGPLQFSARLRNRRRALHRAIGRTYLLSVAVSALASLVMAPFNTAGMVGFFGFGTLAVLWLWTGGRAYRAIRTGDVPSHQAWMIRNYALTYAAVTLRVLQPLFLVVQLVPFSSVTTESYEAAWDNGYAAVPFLCWLINLVVAEWLVRRRGLPSYRLTSVAAV